MKTNVLTGIKLCCVIIGAALLYLFILPDPVSGSEIRSFAVAPFCASTQDDDLVFWHEGEDGHYLFLPAGTDPDTAKVYFSSSDTVAIDGTDLIPGQSASAFTEGEHTLRCGDSVYPLKVCISANIPAMFIVTRSGSLDFIHESKANKEPAAVRIYEDGELILDKDLTFIKMRGNSSTIGPKIPYTIKFRKKTDLFGMGKAKKWTLLANRLDYSLIHNDYAWELAKAFGLHYSSDYRHVDLYINGDYRGSFVVCEKVEPGPDRIDIPDLEKANERANRGIDLDSLPPAGTGENGSVPEDAEYGSAKWVDLPEEPEDISGGYLLEFQLAPRYKEETCGFVTKNGLPIVIREPEHAGEKETAYIRSFVEDAVGALYSADGYNTAGKYYTEYFDMDSFVNMYILQELSNNIDAGQTSFFMVKAGENGKLVFSPVWDMDLAFGAIIDRFEVNTITPDIWWANSMSYPDPTVLTAAYRHDDFREAVRTRWAQMLEENVFTPALEKVNAASAELEKSGPMNVLRWLTGADPSGSKERYAGIVSRSQEFLDNRIKALTKGFSENSAMLYYDANGGSGEVYNRQILQIGEPAVIIDYIQDPNKIEPPGEELEFAGWNIMPDGSGETYQPGDSLILDSPTTILYAVWAKK